MFCDVLMQPTDVILGVIVVSVYVFWAFGTTEIVCILNN